MNLFLSIFTLVSSRPQYYQYIITTTDSFFLLTIIGLFLSQLLGRNEQQNNFHVSDPVYFDRKGGRRRIAAIAILRNFEYVSLLNSFTVELSVA